MVYHKKMRYLGIDYGMRRIGVAVAESETRIAMPRGVIVRAGDARVIADIASMVKKELIEKIVVGLPLALDGQETAMSRAARAFGEQLGAAIGIPVEFENEIFTTRMAEHEGVKKQHVDAASAAIILQSYLDKQNL